MKRKVQSIVCTALAVLAASCSDALPELGTSSQAVVLPPFPPAALRLGTPQEQLSAHALGTSLPNGWVKPERYAELRKGLLQLGYGLFRFPNGSWSNNYHWNGGDYYDANGVWAPEKWVEPDKAYAPGFFVQTKYRGTTRVHVNGNDASLITDGDSQTFWWSDRRMATPPRFYLELPGGPFTTVVIRWAAPSPRPALSLSVYNPAWPHWAPQEVPGSQWTQVPVVSRSDHEDGLGWVTELTTLPTPARHLRVQLAGRGVRVAEVSVLTILGHDLVNHSPDPNQQTKVVAAPTDVASVPSPPESFRDASWDFEQFIDYLPAGAEPLICVNYGTGTAAEAAAWVDYANNERGLGIAYWHVGNEMQGAWEDGGPISAQMYAEKFLRFSSAMKAADGTIKVIGPVYSSTMDDPDSQDQDDPDINWMESFLQIVGARERADNRKYLDGVDLHQYPYWAPIADLDEQAMLDASDLVLARFQRLRGWIDENLLDPRNVSVHMSEYNSTVENFFAGNMGVPNALATANIATSLLKTFPAQAHAYFWAPSPGTPLWSSLPPNDYGDTALFSHAYSRVESSLNFAPSADYWSQYMLNRVWLRRGVLARYVPVAGGEAQGLRVHAVTTADSLRVLVLNLSRLPRTVQLAGTGLPFGTQGTVYEWGEREFHWQGTDRLARATANGGPSSRPIPVGSSSVVVGPLSMNVVVISTPSAPSPVEIAHLAAINPSHDEPDAHVTGSVRSNAGRAISALEISWDGTTFTPIPASDGALDGPAEAFNLVNPLRPACSPVTVRARADAGYSSESLGEFIDASRLGFGELIDNFDGPGPHNVGWNFKWCPPMGPAVAICSGGEPCAWVENAALHATYDGVGPGCVGTVNRWLGTAAGSDGLRFRFKTEGDGVAYAVRAHSIEQGEGNDDAPGVDLRGTNGQWATVSVAWSEFRQLGFGAPIGPLGGDQVDYVRFDVFGQTCPAATPCSGSGSFWIDSLELISCP